MLLRALPRPKRAQFPGLSCCSLSHNALHTCPPRAFPRRPPRSVAAARSAHRESPPSKEPADTAAEYNNKSIHELPFTSPFFNYSSTGAGVESIKPHTEKPTFEEVLKKDTPLHDSGHCSLEDRDGSEVLSEKTQQQEPSIHETLHDPPKSIPPEVAKQLPSAKESQSLGATRWLNRNLDLVQRYIFTAGQTLNDFTGYSAIGALKQSIERQETVLAEWREKVRKYKEQYAQAIASRSASQREVNELLQRKHAWTPPDLERFTELYRSDHANAHSEADAEKKLSEAERSSEEAQNELSKLISARYHEEQIWSDKIRRASTWGTWGLMGINICLFVIVQLAVEPRKRARLVGSFEDVVQKHFDEERVRQQAVLEAALAAGPTTDSTVSAPPSSDSSGWSAEDRKSLERIEHLAEAESEMLQRLTVLFPAVSEPAEIFSHEELSASPFSAANASSLPSSALTWKNLPHRLLGDIIPMVKSRIRRIQGPKASSPPDDGEEEGHGNAIITNRHYELPETVTVRPIEFAGAAGAGAAFGVLLGVLVTLIAKS